MKINEWFGKFYDMIQKALAKPNAITIGEYWESLFSKVVVFGVGFLIFLYLSLNVGMVCGLLPVVGAPLPLLSYGGTSLLTVLIGVGMVLSINIHDKKV